MIVIRRMHVYESQLLDQSERMTRFPGTFPLREEQRKNLSLRMLGKTQ